MYDVYVWRVDAMRVLASLVEAWRRNAASLETLALHCSPTRTTLLRARKFNLLVTPSGNLCNSDPGSGPPANLLRLQICCDAKTPKKPQNPKPYKWKFLVEYDLKTQKNSRAFGARFLWIIIVYSFFEGPCSRQWAMLKSRPHTFIKYPIWTWSTLKPAFGRACGWQCLSSHLLACKVPPKSAFGGGCARQCASFHLEISVLPKNSVLKKQAPKYGNSWKPPNRISEFWIWGCLYYKMHFPVKYD